MKAAAKRLIWLDNARILSAFLIVMVHFTTLTEMANSQSFSSWIINRIFYAFGRCGIPLFIMISGALQLSGDALEDQFNYYYKRARRIVPLIIIWSLIYLVFQISYEHYIGVSTGDNLLINTILYGKPHYHLWFLYMVCGLYLITPYFRKMLVGISEGNERNLIFSMFAIAILEYINTMINPGAELLFIHKFIIYIPYYFLGHYISGYSFSASKYFMMIILSLFSIITLSYFDWKYSWELIGNISFGYVNVFIISLSIGLLGLIKLAQKPMINRKACTTLSELSLGIYLIHPVILKLLWVLYPEIEGVFPVISILCGSFFVFFLSLVLSAIIWHTHYFNVLITGFRD